jgi:hypothetical protein
LGARLSLGGGWWQTVAMLRFLSFLRATLIGLCLLGLVGCNRAVLMSGYSPQEAQSHVEAYFNQLRNHQWNQLQEEIAPGVGGADDIQDQLVKMAEAFPPGAPLSVKMVGYRRTETPEVVTDSMTLEYEFPQKWLIADVTTETRDGDALISGIHVAQRPEPLEALNRFTLRGKGVAQYAMLLLWLMAISLTLFAFVLCIRTRIEKWKWLWLIFILLGVGQVAINWTTNESSFRLFYLQMPPSMAFAAFYGPWILSVSLPLGAIVFLAKRNSLSGSASSGRG